MNIINMAMESTKLDSMKLEFVRDFLCETDENVVTMMIASFKRMTYKDVAMNSPCCFSLEELKKEIELAEEDYRAGRVVSIESLRSKHPSL